MADKPDIPYRRAAASGEEAMPVEPPTGGIPKWTLFPLALVLIAAIVWIIAGNETSNVFMTAAWGLLLLPVLTAGWMLGIAITEPFARRQLFDDSPWPEGLRSVAAVALGLGAFSIAMVLLGSAKLVSWAAPWPAVGLLVLAAIIGLAPTRRFLRNSDRTLLKTKIHRGDLLLLLASVPIAMLIVSATFPPGTLWATEARGYDVMEYHLQLPREYLEYGSTAPLSHNVYSFFPANMEMLYLLVTQLAQAVIGDGSHLWGTFPAQFLHVVFMLLTTAAIALCPTRRLAADAATGATGRAAAVLLFLGVPWTIVTGSLAYNEGGMLLFGTLALVLALGGTRPVTPSVDAVPPGPVALPAISRGILIGLFLGLAVGCKLTAGFFFAVPAGVILLLRAINQPALAKSLAVAVLVAAAVYLPWAGRTAVASGGNPTFPFFSSFLGQDGWTSQELAKFEAGHKAPETERSLTARLLSLRQNALLDPQWSPSWRSIYIWTRNDPPEDRLIKFVGLLWFALPLGLALAFARTQTRGMAALLLVVLGVQIVAWLFFTHLAARFLLPISIPLALLAALAAQNRPREVLFVGGLRVVVATAIAIHAMCTIFLLLPERGLLGGTAHPEGAAPPPQPIGQLFEQQINVSMLGHPELQRPGAMLDPAQIPAPETVLLVGDATAWRYAGRADQVIYSTVFNRNLLGDILALDDNAKRLELLHAKGIHWILINWPEIDRLRRTYGFDPRITPEAMQSLTAAGPTEVKLGVQGLTLLHVPD